jgi:hypothetical protein
MVEPNLDLRNPGRIMIASPKMTSWSFRHSLVFVFWLVGSIGLWVSVISVGNAKPVPPLKDLPEATSDFIVRRHAVEVLLRAHATAFDLQLRRDDINATTRSDLEAAAAHVRALLVTDLSVASIRREIPKSAARQYDLEFDGVRLTDPAPRLWAIATRYQSVARNDCARLHLIQAPDPTEREERHNFLVFFSRSVQGLCDGTVEWHPTMAAKRNLKLFMIFAQRPEDRGELFWNLHSYLENPRNGSFRRRLNIFFSIYSMYLSLSYQNRYVGLAVNEFLSRHDPQMRSVKEFDFLRPVISAQLLAGVLQ